VCSSDLSQLEEAGINLRAHGFSFEPNEVRKLRVPSWVLTSEVHAWTNAVLSSGIVTAADYTTLDAFCARTDLTPLAAEVSEMMRARRKIEELLAKAAEAKKTAKKSKAKKVKKKSKKRTA